MGTLEHIGITSPAKNTFRFVVWAPLKKSMALKLLAPRTKLIPMQKDARGYWSCTVKNLSPQTRYFYLIDQSERRPDPASNFQPNGVHGPSQVVAHDAFVWKDKRYKPLKLTDFIIYELHIGAFTKEGTFEAAITKLSHLKNLGITAVEIMPVAQFPGERNWGYDGAYPYAVHNSYGGPEGLKKFVNACHAIGLAVVLDVVYNHLGPEGSYPACFAPYFSNRYKTPWGDAINYDCAWSCGVRNYVIQNALHWFKNYHIDALRLDAIHGIFDASAKHILQELKEETERYCRDNKKTHYLIAESDLNDVRVIQERTKGGYGIDAQWSDDFHHSLHALLTHERCGYYQDYGTMDDVVKAYREGFVYDWRYSTHRKRFHGSGSKGMPAGKFVVFLQNHDLIGNRMRAERLSTLVPFEALKCAAGALFISPSIPLLFMGEEYGETNPFLYFISHLDKKLINAVRNGRLREFTSFGWTKNFPDPQSASSFNTSKLDWGKLNNKTHRILLSYYRQLINLRKSLFSTNSDGKKGMRVWSEGSILFVERRCKGAKILCIMNLSAQPTHTRIAAGAMHKVFDSSDKKWNGPGSALPLRIPAKTIISLSSHQFAVYVKY